MARRKTNPLRTGGQLWGPRRVRLQISIRELERLSGVARPTISGAESGRIIPTASEYDRIESVLTKAETEVTVAVGEPVARPS